MCVKNAVVLFFGSVLSFAVLASEPRNDSGEFTQKLEMFFSNLFCKEFGYTLIGEKPISVGEVEETEERCFSELEKAFDVSPNLVLKIFSDGPCRYIELINKRALRELVRRNPVVQNFVKKRFKNEREFYSQIEDRNKSIFTSTKNNDRIIGYLLGYDEANIEYYIRRVEVGLYLQKYPFVRHHPLPGGKYSRNPFVFLNPRLRYVRLQPSPGFDTLEAEWQWIKKVEWDIGEESEAVPPRFVALPMYICRRGGTSEQAREKFKKASGRVAELFHDESFQSAVMEAAKR